MSALAPQSWHGAGCSTPLATPKEKRGPQREKVLGSGTDSPQESVVPLLTINVNRLQLPILLHFHPLSPILNNPAERQTDRWMDGQGPGSQSIPAACCKA